MRNWGFLLLAFVAVFQPIASFTERGDVDGRQQRCDYRAASLLRESGVRFHGVYRFTKPASGDHGLNQWEDTRHNEVRGKSISTPSQKQLSATIERGDRTPTRIGRFSRDEYRLDRNAAVLRRESRGAQHGIDHRDERLVNGRRRSIYQIRQNTFDSRLRRVIDDDRRNTNRHSSTARLSMGSRKESQNNHDNTEAHRVREIRLTLGAHERVRDDVTSSNRNARRIARERIPKADVRPSESPLQVERTANHGTGPSRNKEFRSSLATRVRVNNEESQMAGDVNRSFDREKRQTQSRRILEKFTRNIQNRASGNQRIFRESSVRIASSRDLRTGQPLENRRESINRDIRFNSDRVIEAQRENRNAQRDTRLVRAKLIQENRFSRREGLSTDHPVETRSSVRETRGIERNFLSVNRAIENGRAFYSFDRGNEKDARKIKDSRRERSSENRYFNRQSCSLRSERTPERRETGQGSEGAIEYFPESDARSERKSRDEQRESRISFLQRNPDIERATREVRRESQIGRDSIKQRNVRTGIRTIENRRSTTETRSDESRSITIENDSRRDTRNERRSRSFNREIDSRDNRRDARILSQKTTSETRVSRSQRDSRAIGREMAVENRRSIQSINRQSRTMEVERNIEIRKVTREVDGNLIRSVRSAESRGETRITTEASRTFLFERSAVNRRERFAQRQREPRDVEKGFQGVLDKESKGVESRIKNMRAWSSSSMDRNGIQPADRATRDVSVDSRRSRPAQRESPHRAEKTSMETERREARHRFNIDLNRRHAFLSTTGYPENVAFAMNWQYLFYMLQGLYLCGILTQLMNEKRANMKRTQSWWSAPLQLLKVD